MSWRSQPRGPDGKWVKVGAGGVVTAAVLAGLMSAVGGGDATTSVGAALDSAASANVSDAQAARAKGEAKQGDDADAFRRLGLKELRKDLKRELRCAAQSFGQVQRFFLRHPCRRLDQRLFLLSDSRGNTLVGSIMWVTMPSSRDAASFVRLEDTYGSGDVTPVGTEVLEVGGIHFTGKHYRSRRDGSLVVIAETEPVGGSPSDAFLQTTADVADVLPPL
jgi:hypothetical protein